MLDFKFVIYITTLVLILTEQHVRTEKIQVTNKFLNAENVTRAHCWDDDQGFNIAKLSVWNSTHVAMTLKHSRPCIDGEPAWIFFDKYVGDGTMIKESYYEVYFNFNSSSEPTLLEHDTSKMIMLYNKSGWHRIFVFYDDALLHLIQRQLMATPDAFPLSVKIIFLGDYYEIAEKGQGNFSAFLSQTGFIDGDISGSFWTYLSIIFEEICQKFSSHPSYYLMQKYVASKTEPLLKELGVQSQLTDMETEYSQDQGALRRNLLLWNCQVDGLLCDEFSRKFFAQLVLNTTDNPIENIESFVVKRFLEVGGKRAFEFAVDMYEKYSDREVIYNLGFSQDPSTVNDLFLKLLNNITRCDTKLNYLKILKNIAKNLVGRPRFFEFISANYKHIEETAKPGWLAYLLKYYARYAASKKDLDRTLAFIDDNLNQKEVIDYIDMITDAVKHIRRNINWMKRNAEDISQWLENRL